MATVSKWDKILTPERLERHGAKCGTLEELAVRFKVTKAALFEGFKRNRRRLKLKKSLMDYMGKPPPGPVNKKAPGKLPSPPKAEDVRFPLSDGRALALKSAQRFVVTAALNNSPVDPKVWGAVQRYAKEQGAVIVVLPVRYKNPTSRIDGKIIDEGAWWPREVLPFMTDDLVHVHEHLSIMGHVRIQATALNPLTGLEALSRGSSAVFGHGQLAMRMVPTPQNKLPKVLYTTGSVSVPNYSATKAGIQGDFHHGLGALVVELDGPRFHIRALVADSDGGFYDVDRYYTARGSRKSKGALALVTGDEHALFNDPDCREATYEGDDSIATVTRAREIVRHDVFDGYSVNHHSDKDPVTQMAKAESGFHKVADELQHTIDFIDATTPAGARNIIVSSNHHDHLLQWLKAKVPLDTPANARTWHELWGLLLPTVRMTPNGAKCGDPFALWAKARMTSDAEFLGSSSNYSIAGIDVSNHGHHGANGSRGSINQFAKVGIRTIVGHSHTPGIRHGCYQVGTSSMLDLEYTHGLSSWAHCHCIVHPNGKRQLILITDGHWRAAPKGER